MVKSLKKFKSFELYEHSSVYNVGFFSNNAQSIYMTLSASYK